MKRFLSLILMMALIFTMPMSVSYASGDIEIVSPGASCTTDISEIEVSCSGASKIIFELDGKKLGETSGEEVLPLSEGAISAGNHRLKVSAVFPDKTAAQKEISFNAMELISIKSFQQNFNGITDTGGGVDMSLAPGTAGMATASSDVGRSGEAGDKSYKVRMGVNEKVGSGSPTVTYTPFKDYGKKGVLTFDFDIKVDSAAATRVLLYNMPLIAKESPYIINYGKMLSTDEPITDGWNNMKIVVDYSVYSSGITTLYHNGNFVYSGPSVNYTTKNPDTEVQFGLKQNQARTDTTRATVWLDNFDFRQELTYGLDKLMYSDGSVWSDCGIGAIPSDTKALKLMLTSDMDSSTINTNTVSLYENGSKLNADVKYNGSDKSITIIPKKTFGKESDITVELSNAVKLSGGYAVKGKLEARVSTENSELTPTSVSFKKNSSLLISGAQLETGDSVSANVTLNNETDAPKPMTVLLYVRQNYKLRGIGAYETTVNPHTELPVNVNIPSLSHIDANGDVSVKVVICDGLKSGVAYMSPIEIN